MSVQLAHIVAMDEAGAIGVNNQLPWHLPKDLQFFKQTTLGKPIIMGRKTYESIGRPLPGRLNIVVTRQKNWRVDGVSVVHSLQDAIMLGEQEALRVGVPEAMLIGGAELYRQSYAYMHKLYLTRVHTRVEGDAFYDSLNASDWRELWREEHKACEKNPFDYSFFELERSSNVD